jgi:hypothetical protein
MYFNETNTLCIKDGLAADDMLQYNGWTRSDMLQMNPGLHKDCTL